MKIKSFNSVVVFLGILIWNAVILYEYVSSSHPSRLHLAGLGVIQIVIGIAAGIVMSFVEMRKSVSAVVQNLLISALAFGSCLVMIPIGGLVIDLLQNGAFRVLMCGIAFVLASLAAWLIIVRLEKPSIYEASVQPRRKGPEAFPVEPA